MNALVHIKIFGEVQGVFFRRSAKLEADELGIVGWVKNKQSFSTNKQSLRSLPFDRLRTAGLEADGSVEVMAQGSKDKVEEFIKWCKKGPPFAKVKNVEIEWHKGLQDFENFSIHD